MRGKQIQRLRQKLGESVEDFAARFLVSPRTVQSWEQDARRPHPHVLHAILALGKIPLDTSNTTK